ncbi:MAG: hypothetical protein PWP03_126 [Candidatus Woesearchaeota archaeon]|nr:hypothetical protein [Candidatus Woesearchaeota archaeon]
MNVSPLWIKRFKDEYLLYNELTEKTYLVSRDVIFVLKEILRLGSLEKAQRHLIKFFDESSLKSIINFLKKNKFLSNRKNNLKEHKLLFKVKPSFVYLFYVLSIIILIFSLKNIFSLNLTSDDLFITDSIWFILVFYAAWLFLTLFHEFSHLFVANAFGCYGRIYFKTIFVFPALVTYIPEVVFLERPKRLLVHFAGMFMDYLMISIFAVLITLFPQYSAVLRFFIMIKFISLVSQLNLHLRTDLYFVIEDVLNTINLKKDTLSFLKKIFHRKRKITLINKQWQILLFLVILIFGYSLNIWFFIKFFLPGIQQISHIKERQLLKISFIIIYLAHILIHFIKKTIRHKHYGVSTVKKSL